MKDAVWGMEEGDLVVGQIDSMGIGFSSCVS